MSPIDQCQLKVTEPALGGPVYPSHFPTIGKHTRIQCKRIDEATQKLLAVGDTQT